MGGLDTHRRRSRSARPAIKPAGEEMAKSFPVVLRVQPVQSGQIQGAHTHQTRTASVPERHVAAERSQFNQVLHGTGNVASDVRSMIASAPLAHTRTTPCAEMILTADSEYFDQISPGWQQGKVSPKLQSWIDQNTAWLREKFPGLSSAILHMDEGAPHIHAMVVPIVEYEQGYRRGSKMVQKVHYNRVFGDTAQVIAQARMSGNTELTKLGRMQTDYASAMAPCGLTRGIRGSRAKRRPIDEHQTLVNTPVKVPPFPTVPVVVKTAGDTVKEALGITSEFASRVAAAEKELQVYRKAHRKYEKQLAVKAREHDAMKTENQNMRNAIAIKDELIAKLSKELDLHKDQVAALRQTPLKEVADALTFEGPLEEGGKPRWRNAIDMVKDVAGLDYKQTVAWLYHEFGERKTFQMAASAALGIAAEVIEKQAKQPDERPYTRQEFAIRSELSKQLDALSAQSYRITMMNESGLPSYNVGKGKAGDGSERLYSAQEVLDLVPTLNKENWRRQYHVYLTPFHTERHYVLLDDLTDSSLSKLRSDGYEPNVIQKTSASSIQAVFKLPSDVADKPAVNAFFREINSQYGDPNISGLIHPMRAVGFRNVKQKHQQANQRFPVVQFVESCADACRRAVEHVRALAAHMAQLVRSTPSRVPLNLLEERIMADPPDDVDVRLVEQAQSHYRLCESIWPNTDWSRADWMLVEKLASQGVSVEQIGAVVRAASPGLAERHPDAERYISETLRKYGS